MRCLRRDDDDTARFHLALFISDLRRHDAAIDIHASPRFIQTNLD